MSGAASGIVRNRRFVFLAAVALAYLVTFVVSDGLQFELRKDERHFWETTAEHFVVPFPPTVEQLRDYPELITPLSLVVWGQLERLTGNGIVAGRALSFGLSLAMLALAWFGGRSREAPAEARFDRSMLAVAGILINPYFLALAVHLFTDVLGSFFALLGVFLHFRGRLFGAALAFVLAISTRQYLVEIPAAIAAWEGIRVLRGERRIAHAASAALGCVSLLAWMAFWGGLAPKAGLDTWISPYPAPMLEPLSFLLDYGLYFLVGVGAYFVIPEAVLTRSFPGRELLRSRLAWALAAGLLVLFCIEPPFLTWNHPGGPFGRATRWLLPGPFGDGVRIVLYYGVALLAVLRFGRRADLGFWLLVVTFILSMKSQIPWEKYYVPVLIVLWTLRGFPRIHGDPAHEPITDGWDDGTRSGSRRLRSSG